MSNNFSIRLENGISVGEFEEETLLDSTSLAGFESSVLAALKAPEIAPHIVISLENVGQFSFAVASVLMKLQSEYKQKNGKLVLVVETDSPVESAVQRTTLDEYIKIFPNTLDAIKYLSNWREVPTPLSQQKGSNVS
jgi:anti-anti-sigma regulatory factor